jgi:hypothetical protein
VVVSLQFLWHAGWIRMSGARQTGVNAWYTLKVEV